MTPRKGSHRGGTGDAKQSFLQETGLGGRGAEGFVKERAAAVADERNRGDCALRGAGCFCPNARGMAERGVRFGNNDGNDFGLSR